MRDEDLTGGFSPLSFKFPPQTITNLRGQLDVFLPAKAISPLNYISIEKNLTVVVWNA